MINTLIVASAEGPQTTFTTIAFVSISFLLLLMLIKKFAWGPITSMLDQRAKKIAEDIDGAELSNEQAAELVQKREKELMNSKAEAAAIIKKAKENAENSAEAIVADARKSAQNYREKAEKDIELEREQIIEASKREVADLSIQIAEKILKKELNKDTHEELINSNIEGLGIQYED